MDRYTERLVKGRPGSEAKLVFGLGILCILGAIGLVVTGIMVKAVIAAIALPVFVLGVFIIYYSLQLFQVEYEYLITNGDIEISKIIAKKRRKVVREIRAEDIVRMSSLSNERARNDLSRVDSRRVEDYTAGEDKSYFVIEEKVKGTEYYYVLDLEGESEQHMKDVLKTKVEK